jgi:long-subunit acyl-CoA synthetase (AMP-forming)
MTAATATTVGELFTSAIAEYECEPALQTSEGAVSWTWGEYGRQAAAAAAGLAALSVGRGSVVACWLTNQIKRYSVIEGEWHPDGDELTPTSKLKRRAIAAKYASEIEAMYPGP